MTVDERLMVLAREVLLVWPEAHSVTVQSNVTCQDLETPWACACRPWAKSGSDYVLGAAAAMRIVGRK